MGFAPSQPFPLVRWHRNIIFNSWYRWHAAAAADDRALFDAYEWKFPSSFMHFSTGEFIRPCSASVKANYDDDERLIVARLFPYTLLRGSKFCRFSQHQVLSGHSAKEIFSQSFWSITTPRIPRELSRRQSRNTSRETFVTIALMT